MAHCAVPSPPARSQYSVSSRGSGSGSGKVRDRGRGRGRTGLRIGVGVRVRVGVKDSAGEPLLAVERHAPLAPTDS